MQSFTNPMELMQIVPAFPPADLDTDRTGDWVSMKNYEWCVIYIHKAAGTAGDDISILTEQATDVAGTGAKALNFTKLYYKVGATALTAVGTWSTVTGTATGDLDTVTAFGSDLVADTGEAVFAVVFKASDLDVSNGFDCLRWSCEGDDLSNPAIGASAYILFGPRQASAAMLSAIVD